MPLEHGHLRGERALKRGARFTTQAIVFEHRHPRNDVRVTQHSQHRRHQQIRRREATFEETALAEPGRDVPADSCTVGVTCVIVEARSSTASSM